MYSLINRIEVVAISMVLLVASGCADVGDAEVFDAASGSTGVAIDAAATTLSAADPVVFGEFLGSFDVETGELTFESLPIEEWITVDTGDAEVMRRVSQALYCERRVPSGSGVPGTVSLTTLPGTIGTVPSACGLDGAALPYVVQGAFCATVGVTNSYANDLTDVVAEIVLVEPPEFSGYEFPFGSGYDPNALPAGLSRPIDAAGGLFYHGDIGVDAQGEQRWIFRNPSGAFRFRGRIMARMTEIDNGADDNCDSWIDDRLSEYADAEACRFNADCISGLCHDIDPAVLPEPVGDCATTCAEGRYGDPCVDCPGGAGASQCSGNGTCDDGAASSGVCTCDAGFANPACDACDTGFWGPSCLPCPTCQNGGVCAEGMAGDGSCSCQAGTHGLLCEYTCFDGLQNGDETGVDCGGASCGACPIDRSSRRALVFERDEGSLADDAARAAGYGTVIDTMDPGLFNSLLSAGGWDIVVCDIANAHPDGVLLADYIAAGGRLVLATWKAGNEPWWSAMGVTVAGVAPPREAHPNAGAGLNILFEGTSSVPALTAWQDIASQDGVRFISGGTALSRFDSSVGPDVAAVLTNGGRVVGLGFIPRYYIVQGDSDGDGVHDVTELLLNAIDIVDP